MEESEKEKSSNMIGHTLRDGRLLMDILKTEIREKTEKENARFELVLQIMKDMRCVRGDF